LLSLLEGAWALFELLYSLIVDWRLWACIVGGLALVFVADRMGMNIGDGDYLLGALVGLVVGVAWELIDAAYRRGYV
jgi:hypothetical protein